MTPLHPSEPLPTLTGLGINSRAFIRRGDGLYTLQLDEDVWLVRDGDVYWLSIDGCDHRHPVDPVTVTSGQWRNYAAAVAHYARRGDEEHREVRTLADLGDDLGARVLGMAVNGLRLAGGAP